MQEKHWECKENIEDAEKVVKMKSKNIKSLLKTF